ncbi:MAG: hypothetical protein U0Z53_24005 [Blastocatellia bacterium]
MNTISIIPEHPGSGETIWRAFSGGRESFGKTAGEAVDALAAQFGEEAPETLIIRQLKPDIYFTAQQQQRLTELMSRWRAAREAGTLLPPEEQTELEGLIEAELQATAKRAEQIRRELEK